MQKRLWQLKLKADFCKRIKTIHVPTTKTSNDVVNLSNDSEKEGQIFKNLSKQKFVEPVNNSEMVVNTKCSDISNYFLRKVKQDLITPENKNLFLMGIFESKIYIVILILILLVLCLDKTNYLVFLFLKS